MMSNIDWVAFAVLFGTVLMGAVGSVVVLGPKVLIGEVLGIWLLIASYFVGYVVHKRRPR